MPNEVRRVPLGSVADIEMGQAPPSSSVTDERDGLPFLQGNAEFGVEFPHNRLFCRQPLKVAERGDVLVSVRAPVGAVNVADQTYCIGRGLAAIRFRTGAPLLRRHLIAYWARDLMRVAQGTTFEAVSKADVESLAIAWPEPGEQGPIAEVLQTVASLVNSTRLTLAKLRSLAVGVARDLLRTYVDEDWAPLGDHRDVMAIGDVAIHVGSGVTPKGGSEVYQKEGVLFIRSQNVTFGGLSLSDVAYIDAATHQTMKRSAIFPGDVLINITGASIGRCCSVPEDLGPANVNQHVCAIRVGNGRQSDAEYLAAVLASPIGQRQVERLNAGGSREGLNYQQVRSIRVPWPDAAERERVAQSLDLLNERIQLEASELRKLLRLQAGLTHDLLTGRVLAKGIVALAEAAI
jgi:type I restriction enzyme, S subunit